MSVKNAKRSHQKRKKTNQPMHQEHHLAPVSHSVKCPWQQQNVEKTFRVTISVDELAQELSHACIQLGCITHTWTHIQNDLHFRNRNPTSELTKR